MKKEIIEVDGKQVAFKASAALPRIYRIQFHRDIFVDLQKIVKSVKRSEEQKKKNSDKNSDTESDIPIEDLSVFEQIAYIMAKHADPEVPEDIMDWLDQFNTFSIYEVLPEIMKLWNLNEQTQIDAKKNLDKVAGN